jgi:hypothetical protein
VKNIFSSEEPTREVDPTFASQAEAQRGGLPTAPPCNFPLPAHPPVNLPPVLERVAEHAGQRVDWKNTRIR